MGTHIGCWGDNKTVNYWVFSCLTMVKFLILLLPLAWAASPSPRDPLHASCSVTWTLSESCATAQQKIVDQMNLWDNEDCETKPDDNKPHGQKCLYHHTGTEGLVTTGTHTTPIHGYVDDLTFTFVEGSDPTCLVDVIFFNFIYLIFIYLSDFSCWCQFI